MAAFGIVTGVCTRTHRRLDWISGRRSLRRTSGATSETKSRSKHSAGGLSLYGNARLKIRRCWKRYLRAYSKKPRRAKNTQACKSLEKRNDNEQSYKHRSGT